MSLLTLVLLAGCGPAECTGLVDCDGDGVVPPVDCDDSDPSVHPWGIETCGGGDEDCDGLADDQDDDPVGAVAWFPDADGDGWGTLPGITACEAPSGHVAEAGDCDDGDPERYPGHRCRPDAGCTHPGVATLEPVANDGISDILFDGDCNAWMPNLVYYDSLQVVHPTGVVMADFPTWQGWTDLHAIAMDPDDGDVWLEGWDDVEAVLLTVEDGEVVRVAGGTPTQGSAWIDVFLNEGATSLASDGTCAWVPNYAGNGTLVCVRDDGSEGVVATLPGRVEGVGFDPDGILHASAGAAIHRVDRSTGDTTEVHALAATVLDFVFDYDGTLYVETTADEIVVVEPGGSSRVFSEVEYDGKLTISPDGWLVRVMPYWNGGLTDIPSRWQEWELGD